MGLNALKQGLFLFHRTPNGMNDLAYFLCSLTSEMTNQPVPCSTKLDEKMSVEYHWMGLMSVTVVWYSVCHCLVYESVVKYVLVERKQILLHSV